MLNKNRQIGTRLALLLSLASGAVFSTLPAHAATDPCDGLKSFFAALKKNPNLLKEASATEGGDFFKLQASEQFLQKVRVFFGLPLNSQQMIIRAKIPAFENLLIKGDYAQAQKLIVNSGQNKAARAFEGSPKTKDFQSLFTNVRGVSVQIAAANAKIKMIEDLINRGLYSVDQINSLNEIVARQKTLRTGFEVIFADSFNEYQEFFAHLLMLKNSADCGPECQVVVEKMITENGLEDILTNANGWQNLDNFRAQIEKIIGTSHTGIPADNLRTLVDLTPAGIEDSLRQLARQQHMALLIRKSTQEQQIRLAIRFLQSEPFISKIIYRALKIIPIVGNKLQKTDAVRLFFGNLVNARVKNIYFFDLSQLVRQKTELVDLARGLQARIDDIEFLETFMRRSDLVGKSQQVLDFCKQDAHRIEFAPLVEELNRALQARTRLGFIAPDWELSPLEHLESLVQIGLSAATIAGISYKGMEWFDEYQATRKLKKTAREANISEDLKVVLERAAGEDPELGAKMQSFVQEAQKRADEQRAHDQPKTLFRAPPPQKQAEPKTEPSLPVSMATQNESIEVKTEAVYSPATEQTAPVTNPQASTEADFFEGRTCTAGSEVSTCTPPSALIPRPPTEALTLTPALPTAVTLAPLPLASEPRSMPSLSTVPSPATPQPAAMMPAKPTLRDALQF